MSDVGLPHMYTDLAEWFHLLTAPWEYVEESEWYLRTIREAAGGMPTTLLELGAGGGNNAFHYKEHVLSVTLTDVSEGMLALSQRLNPECSHVVGDMRTLRLGREFDSVLVHDAVCYMTTLDDLRQAMQTAFVHLRRGGVALFAPDHVRELFPVDGATDHGGNDSAGRGLRYIEWTYDPDPADSVYLVDYAFLLHEEGLPTRAVYDRHVCGLFSRAEWLRVLADVGFDAKVTPFEHSEVEPGTLEVFVATKPPSDDECPTGRRRLWRTATRGRDSRWQPLRTATQVCAR
jgi:SAM-dependent methyltransferase